MVSIISLSLKSIYFFKRHIHLQNDINDIQKEALQIKKKKTIFSRRYEKTLFRSFRTKLWLHLGSKQTKEVKTLTWNTFDFTGINLVDKCKIYTKAKFSFTSLRILTIIFYKFMWNINSDF